MATPAIYILADRLAPALRAAFLAAVAQIRSRTSLSALTAALETGDPAAIVAAIQVARLPAALAPAVAVIEQVVTQAAERTLTAIAVRAAFDLVNPLAATAARTQGAQFVTLVTAETQAAIRALVARAVTEGIAPRELARLIQPLIGLTRRQAQAALNARAAWEDSGLTGDVLTTKVDAYAAKLLKQRALMIARTETIDAANAGQLAAWQDAAAKGLLRPDRTFRIWSAANDPRVCPICAELDAQVVGFDEPFVTIDGIEIMAPPVHPLCRCSVSLVFDDKRRAA